VKYVEQEQTAAKRMAADDPDYKEARHQNIITSFRLQSVIIVLDISALE
jgi:hypothetical protein